MAIVALGVSLGVILVLGRLHGLRGYIGGIWLVLTSALLAAILWDAARSEAGTHNR